MTSTSMANPAAWTNALAVSMIDEIGLMSSILPTDGTNYAAEDERMWGRYEMLDATPYDQKTFSTLWTGKPDNVVPPATRFLPRLFEMPALSVSDADRSAIQDIKNTSRNSAQSGAFYNQLSYVEALAGRTRGFLNEDIHDELKQRLLGKKDIEGTNSFFTAISEAAASIKKERVAEAAKNITDEIFKFDTQGLLPLSAIAWELSADLMISAGAEQSEVLHSQYHAAQAYLRWLLSIDETDNEVFGREIALDRGYLIAMNGALFSIYLSGLHNDLFIELASNFADLSQENDERQGQFANAAAHAARKLWLKAHCSDGSQSTWFFDDAQMRIAQIAGFLDRAFVPMARKTLLYAKAKEARHIWRRALV